MFLTSALEDLRRGGIADQPSLMGKMSGFRSHQAHLRASSSPGTMPGWLDDQLPDVARIGVSSNAEGARRARDERGTAAIAGRAAAEIYALSLLANEIEDRPDNTTRFLVVGRNCSARAVPTAHAAAIDQRHRRCGSAVSVCSSRWPLHSQHDAHRSRPSRRRNWTTCSSSISKDMSAIRLWPRRSPARGARIAVQGAGFLSAGRALMRGFEAHPSSRVSGNNGGAGR